MVAICCSHVSVSNFSFPRGPAHFLQFKCKVQNCSRLVPNATGNWVLVNRILRLVAIRQLTFSILNWHKGIGFVWTHWFLCQPYPAVNSIGLCFFSDITFDQNWHHLYSSSAGGKDLSSDTQIRVIGAVEPEICTKMLRNLSEKLGAKFPVTARGLSMVKISHRSRWCFLRSWRQSQVNHCSKKIRKGQKGN